MASWLASLDVRDCLVDAVSHAGAKLLHDLRACGRPPRRQAVPERGSRIRFGLPDEVQVGRERHGFVVEGRKADRAHVTASLRLAFPAWKLRVSAPCPSRARAGSS